MKRAIIIIFSISLLLHGYTLFRPGRLKNINQFDVKSGASAHQIVRQLLARNILFTRYIFLGWTKIRKAESKIKVGRYRFNEGRSAYWILDDMIKGRTQKMKILIPEGYATWQIAESLDDFEVCKKNECLAAAREDNLEGFLYPATYEMEIGFLPRDVLKVLTQEFDRRWTADLEARAKERGWTKKEAVTMASIIEREVKQRSELPLVSALYNNRLKKGMKLEADPTVQYALGFWKTRLLYADYRNTISPYNTYLHKGLPPGPICSPGTDAIRAALWPADAPYLYMVAKEDGFHDFSTTYHDHTNKVNKRNQRRQTAAH